MGTLTNRYATDAVAAVNYVKRLKWNHRKENLVTESWLMKLIVEKIEEAGFTAAMVGLALNKNQSPERMPGIAKKLSAMDLGHNKFLEHLMVWVTVIAPRYWWQDADTYRLTSKQSQSTNHTVMRRPLTSDDFEDEDVDYDTLWRLNSFIEDKKFLRLKKYLPEGFLQAREWRLDYKTIRGIILQRRNHVLPHWQEFIKQLLALVDHPEFLPGLDKPEGAKHE